MQPAPANLETRMAFLLPSITSNSALRGKEHVMRTFNTAATLAAAFVGLLVGSASAQETVIAKIPFSFVVHGEQFSAGRYNVTNEGGILTIRGMDNGAGMFALTIPADGRDPAGNQPALVFTPYENEYRLSEIWESNADGFALPEPSRVPRRGCADVKPAASEARTIVLVANWI
jgi:hypothetical protein